MNSEEPRPQHGAYRVEEGVFYVYWEGEIVGKYHTEAEAKAAYLRLSDALIEPGGKA